MEKYHELKVAIRDGEKKAQTENKKVQTPDLDKLKGELRKEIKQEFQKKIDLLTAVSKFSTSIFQKENHDLLIEHL